DTVKQIQLFHRSGAYPYQIMLLSFTPNFRHFIHRQSVYHAPYWSCFDAIQQIRRKKAMVLSFHDLNWPQGIEFVYTPFVILAMLNNEKYAQIEFGEDGNPIQIDMYKNGVICRRNLYDDRGFVSGSIVYKNAKPLYQDYLMENGLVKMRQFIQDGHVEINQQYCQYLLRYEDKEIEKTFAKIRYDKLDDVIFEVLSSYIELTKREDIFCIAMHERHAVLLNRVLSNKKKILTFFENRYDILKRPEVKEMIEKADYVITDSQRNSQLIKMVMDNEELHNIADITPYDSRVDFGISQQLTIQKILVPVDSIGEEIFKELIYYLGKYLLTNPNAQIHLFTRSAEYNRKSRLLEKTRHYLGQFGMEEAWAVEESNKVSENGFGDDLVSSESIPIRFVVEQCVDELSVSKCMREQRVIVDMREISELYLRIAAISVGIPQIVRTETKFVEHQKNGMVIKDIKELPSKLDFYLNGLNNWNEAMIYSYELGKKYTTSVLVDKWKEVIDFVE
ncbi:MAG: accessory Sec system protein Asp1, partial [Eubacteriales bacterium]|nr:accessory Sec system protein Asp1 [Eubacteriales bacterium]